MADPQVNPGILRLYIGDLLKELREAAPNPTPDDPDHKGFTLQEAAKLFQKGRSTLARMEAGDPGVKFRDVDVKELLRIYSASPRDVELLLQLTAETRNGHERSWWHDAEGSMPVFFGLYVRLEDSAEVIRQYENGTVPGLLQTREYALHVHRVPAGFVDEIESERRVRIRLERQSLLTRIRAPHLDVIIDEAVLRRPVGGAEVMREQLKHLLDMTQRGNVRIRVLPFAAGVHGGMAASTPFTLLTFPTDLRRGKPVRVPLAYVDTLTGALYLNKDAEYDAYRLTWEDIEGRVLDETASSKMITTTMEGLSGD